LNANAAFDECSRQLTENRQKTQLAQARPGDGIGHYLFVIDRGYWHPQRRV